MIPRLVLQNILSSVIVCDNFCHMYALTNFFYTLQQLQNLFKVNLKYIRLKFILAVNLSFGNQNRRLSNRRANFRDTTNFFFIDKFS